MSCDNKNPLQRNGSGQQQRMPEALKDGYVLVEERDYKEWIVFASQFAQWIKYFDNTNQSNGNWQSFFTSDISAVLGSTAIQDIDEYRRSFKEKFDVLRADKNKLKADLLKETFNGLFGGILALCVAIDAAAAKLPDGNPLKETIQNLVRSRLQNEFTQLLAVYKGAAIASLVKETTYPGWFILNKQVENPSHILTNDQLSAAWLNGAATLNDYYQAAGLAANTEIFGTDTEPWQKIHHAVNHNLFTGIFDQFLKAYTRIISDAEHLLLQTLSNWSSHAPHYTLFLTFLKLFKYAKAGINTLTQRHLDFYYKEVLSLVPRAEIPDHVHLVMELAKQTNEYMLAKGSLFKAGKDSLGKELFYALDKDTAFNKASIAALMNVYKGDADDKTGKINNKGRLFAAAIANSQDGKGAELKSLNKEWHPFFIKTYADGKLKSIDTPRAQVGFAVASHYLYLTEGERAIDLTMQFAGGTYEDISETGAFECYATTDKGWYRIKTYEIFCNTNSSGKAYYTVHIMLNGNEPPITNYVAAVHGGSFNCNLPVVKVYLNQGDDMFYYYDSLSGLKIEDIKVSVSVGNSSTYSQSGLKQLSVANDAGLVDTSKPFQPFGALPKAGSSIFIGNKELFCKKNAAVVLNIEWKNLPADGTQIIFPAGTAPGAAFRHLAKGVWTKDLDTSIFNGSTAKVAVTNASGKAIPLADETIVDYADTYQPYNGSSNKGFLRLSLNNDLGNDAYQNQRIVYLVKLAKNPTITDQPPVAPYTPMISSLYASYTASTNSQLNKQDQAVYNERTARYFHLYPFGESEQHAYLNKNATLDFLPQFTHAEETKDHIADNGSFFIGLKDLKPQQSVNVLFQVMEGTSDPTLSVTGTLIHWSYLRNNQWKPFDEQSVVDQTRSLRQSGIISFQIPEDATLQHTMMPTGLIWLKASVSPPNKPAAVCKLLHVAAQAAAVSFADQHNAPDFLNNALPANTISKLKDPVSDVKKISQPYPSFGGKPVETSTHFYMRVNERLRHKDRAITIWDYERLVLEAFPEIHRVKCLNHTKYINKDYNEVAPGHVTVITIPDLVNRNDINPLRPYTNADTLDQVKEFLQKRISCHVQLNVCNPVFEDVLLEFNLKLFSGYEFSYYSNLLKENITALLSPWAYGKADDIRFGGKIEKSVLINFIESQYYVDYITDVKMYHLTENNQATLTDEDEITASMAISILVSVPADKHLVHQIPDDTATNKITICKDEYNKLTHEKD